jgi:hypothetical protein
MTEEEFIQIFEGDSDNWEGDNAFQGLQIIAKYIDPAKHIIIDGAGHDELWSVDISKIIEAGITRDDVVALRKLNWSLNDDTYLMLFV